MTLGEIVRNLRIEKGVSLKKMAPEIEIEYTYLSKIENGYIVPSAEVVYRIAEYFNHNQDELMMLADRIPPDVREILRNNPKEALDFLRQRFGEKVDGR